jgi:hypothetical protein
MAGDWIKWDKGLAWKPEVLAIAAKLKMTRKEVAATLMELWEWADEITEDGHAPSVTFVTVDERTGVAGLSRAMSEVRWLHQTDEGVCFPKFERHNGASAKARLLAAERKRHERSRAQRDKSHDAGVTKA